MSKRLKLAVPFLTSVLVAGWGTQANAAVLTFDDISSKASGIIPNEYGGLSWSNFGYMKTDLYKNNKESGYKNSAMSGNYVAYNKNATIKSSTTQSGTWDFSGAYLTAAWRDGLKILVEGLLNGETKYSQVVTVDTKSSQYFDFNYAGVDTVRFASWGGTPIGKKNGGTHFAMENFTYNAGKSVPEPSGLLLMGAGLGALAWTRRKRQQQL